MEQKLINLYDTLLLLETNEEVTSFFQDLCTPQEIKTLHERWKVAQLLASGTLSYRAINKNTGASLTTIGRVARFLNEENNNGYKLGLLKCKNLS